MHIVYVVRVRIYVHFDENMFFYKETKKKQTILYNAISKQINIKNYITNELSINVSYEKFASESCS